MITIAIIDDEKSARTELKKEIRRLTPNNVIIWEADSVLSGIQELQKRQPDLLFLDIELSDGTGFDILEDFSNSSFKTVFITAFNEYAIKAFRFSAFDYLLKPIDSVLLANTLKKSTDSILQHSIINNLNHLLNMRKTQKFDKLIVQLDDGYVMIVKEEIVRIEANGNYSWFILVNGEKIISVKPMGDYEEMLDDEGFVRVHVSHLINLKHVKRVFTKEIDFVIMDNGDKIEVARRRKTRLLELLQQ